MPKVILVSLCFVLISATCFAQKESENLRNFFPFGIWYQGRVTDKGIYQPTMMEDIAALGMNFAIANANTDISPNDPSPASLKSMLDLADRTGIKMLVGLSPLVKVELRALKPADFDARHDEIRAKLAPFVAEGKKHSSVLGWWLGDEPITAGVEQVKSTEKLRLIFAELDDVHPAWSEGPWGVIERDVVPHIANLNEPIYMPEIYPFWNRPYQVGVGDFRSAGFLSTGKNKDKGQEWKPVDLVEQFRSVRPLLKDRPLWPWLASFREPTYEAPGWDWRAPTAAELSCLSWISVAEGSKGLGYFGYEHMRTYGEHAELFGAIKSIIESINPVTDVLLDCHVSENIASIQGGGSRYYKTGLVETLRDSHSTPYLAVVNRNCEETGTERITLSARLPKAPAGQSWLAVDCAKNSLLAVGGSSSIKFELTMEPGAGKLVRIISSGEIKPAIEPDIKWVSVGEQIPFKATGGIYPSGKTFYRWSVSGFPAGTIDAKTGLFTATAVGRCTVWARDEASNSAFTRDVVVQ